MTRRAQKLAFMATATSGKISKTSWSLGKLKHFFQGTVQTGQNKPTILFKYLKTM